MKITIEQKQHLERVRKTVRMLSNGKVSGLFDNLTAWLDKIKERLFDKQGGDYGRKKWVGISPTLEGKLRRTSNGKKSGEVFDAGSKPLQVSGRYRASFKAKTSPRWMTYGSRIKQADKLPYAGWNRKDGKYEPRYALPDMTAEKTIREKLKISRQTVRDFIRTIQ